MKIPALRRIVVAFGTFFLVPHFVSMPFHLSQRIASELHYGFGAGVVAVGLYLLPVGVGVVRGAERRCAGRRYGGKWPFVAGTVMLALSSALLAFVHTNRYEFVVWLFLLGAGFGLATGSAGVFITELVEADKTGVANAFNRLARLICGGIGARIAAALIKSQSLPGSHAVRESAFMIAFGVSALLALIAAGLLLLIPSGKNAEAGR
ncbi:MAG: MFS transporter [Gammaproteobacteria bacterium]